MDHHDTQQREPDALPSRRGTELTRRRLFAPPAQRDQGSADPGFGAAGPAERPSRGRLTSADLLGPRLNQREAPPVGPRFNVVDQGWDRQQVEEYLDRLRRWAEAQHCRAEAAERMLEAALTQLHRSEGAAAEPSEGHAPEASEGSGSDGPAAPDA